MADRITYVGLDVHKESIVVAVASGGLRGEVREYGRIANTAAALDALIDFDSMVDKYAEVFREAWLSAGTRGRNEQLTSRGSAPAPSAMAGSAGTLDP